MFFSARFLLSHHLVNSSFSFKQLFAVYWHFSSLAICVIVLKYRKIVKFKQPTGRCWQKSRRRSENGYHAEWGSNAPH